MVLIRYLSSSRHVKWFSVWNNRRLFFRKVVDILVPCEKSTKRGYFTDWNKKFGFFSTNLDFIFNLMDRILRLGAGGLPGVGQVSFRRFSVTKKLLISFFSTRSHCYTNEWQCLTTYMHYFSLEIINSYDCFLIFKTPPTDAPIVDTAEQVYISSLALLKVRMIEIWVHDVSWIEQ